MKTKPSTRLFLIVILMLVLPLLAAFDGPGDAESETGQLILWLAGMVLSPVIQWSKNKLGAKGLGATFLMLAFAAGASVFAIANTSGFVADAFTPDVIFVTLGQIIAGAVLAYGVLKNKMAGLGAG